MYKKCFIKTEYEIDDSKCKCGSDNVQYEIHEVIRENGASERVIMKTVISQKLEKAYCPDCGMIFDFINITNHTN